VSDSQEDTAELRIAPLAEFAHWIPDIAQWLHAEWRTLYPGGYTPADVEAALRTRLNTRQIPLALVAVADNTVVGIVSLKLSDMDTRPGLTPWLAGLYVVPARRRAGVGRRLVQAATAKARESGATKLYLYTPAAEPFYATLGWQVLERTSYQEIPVTVMYYSLQPGALTHG
jgi:predicted N-acetyltransferase YhbS